VRISVRDSDELRAVVLAFKVLPRALRTEINKATRETLNPIWQEEVRERLVSPMDARVLGAGVRVKAGNPPVVQAATSTRAIGRTRRLRPASSWQAWEFGAADTVTTYRRTSTKGTTHTVKRHTRRGLPPRTRDGRVIHPAYRAAVPRMASRWVQGVVRLIHEAAEGKAGS
jgi:hypothetical protein